MYFLVLLAVVVVGLVVSLRLSPYTERFMRLIWSDPTDKMKVKIAKRVKELCVDGDVPRDTAALMIAKENKIMENQVRDIMRSAMADPVILRMAFGSRIGNMVYRGLKNFSEGGAR